GPRVARELRQPEVHHFGQGGRRKGEGGSARAGMLVGRRGFVRLPPSPFRLVKEDVSRLEVAVDDAADVRRVDGTGQPLDEFGGRARAGPARAAASVVLAQPAARRGAFEADTRAV